MDRHPDVFVADPFGRGSERLFSAPGLCLADMIGILRQREGWSGRNFRIWIGTDEISPEHWSLFVPADGEQVLITPLPQLETAGLLISTLISTFSGVVSEVAADFAILSSFIAPGLVTAAGVESAIYSVMAGVAAGTLSRVLGNHPGAGSASYGVTGTSNTADSDGFCPIVLGKRRVVPRLAASPWTVTNGDDVDLIMLVQWHVGRCQVSDIKIGDVPIGNYTGVTIQHRLAPTDPFPDLYNRVVREATFSSLMLSHDDGPVQRRTDENTTHISLDFAWPMGLAWNGKDNAQVILRIRYRAVGATEWISAPGGTFPLSPGLFLFSETKTKAFRRNVSWDVAEGQYDVEVYRTSNDAGDSYPRLQDQAYWVVMRSFGTGLPVTDDDLPITAIKITATDQLNGQIQDLNGIVEPLIPKWNSTTKAFSDLGTSRNPGEQINWIATGKQNARPLINRVATETLGAFTELCNEKNWKCDYIIDSDMSVGEALRTVAATGRAFPSWEDGMLGVAVDGVQDAPCQVFSGRNVKNFTGTALFPDELHAVYVGFYDETSGYEQQVRTVYANGYNASNATLYERIDAPAKTDPNEAWVVGWRYLAARAARPEVYEFDCDLEGLVVRFGKRIDIAHSCMAVGIRGTRVSQVITRADGFVIGFVIDEEVPMESGTSYVLRVQRGSSVGLFNIITEPGTTDTLMLQTPVAQDSAPVVGNHGIFGLAGSESMPAIVIGISPHVGKDSHITAVPYAPELQADAGEIPQWSPKITRVATEDGLAVGHVGDTTQKHLADQVIATLANQIAEGPPANSVGSDQLSDAVRDALNAAEDGIAQLNGVTSVLSTNGDATAGVLGRVSADLEKIGESVASLSLTVQQLRADQSSTLAWYNSALTKQIVDGQSAVVSLVQDWISYINALTADGGDLSLTSRITTIEQTTADYPGVRTNSSLGASAYSAINTPSVGLAAQVANLSQTVAALDTSGASATIQQVAAAVRAEGYTVDLTSQDVGQILAALMDSEQRISATAALYRNEIKTQVIDGLNASAVATGELGVLLQTTSASIAASISTETSARVAADTAEAAQRTAAIASLQTSLGTKADASAVQTLSASVSTISGAVSEQGGAITGLQLALDGYSTPGAIGNALSSKASVSALDTLTGSIDNISGTLAAQSQALTTLQSVVGETTSTAVMKIGTSATSDGAAATVGFIATAISGAHSAAAGWKVDVVVQGSTTTSRLVAYADEIDLLANCVKAENLVAGAASMFTTVSPVAQGQEVWTLQEPADTITISADRRVKMSTPISVPTNMSKTLVIFSGSFVATTGATTWATAGFEITDIWGVKTNVVPFERRFSVVNDVASFEISATISRNATTSQTIVPWVASNGQTINARGFGIITFSQR